MKTKRILMILLVFMMIWTTKSYASHVHLYLDSVTTTPSWHYFCNIDSVIVYEKSDAITTNYFRYEVTGDNYPNLDSMVIITSTQSGEWRFSSPETGAWFFYIYSISSPPIEPTCMVHDTSFCTATFSLPLDAQNQNPGGHAATYLWSTGATTRTMTVTTPGYYWVIVTNACGVDTFDITITQSNSNVPNLGPDQSICLGDSVTLTGTISNPDSYLWSTGDTTSTINVENDGEYWVYAEDLNGCSGRDTIYVSTMQTSSQQILLATINIDPVDPNYGNNMITWEVDPLLVGSIDSVYIYREMGTNTYVLVGTAAYADGEWSDVVNSVGHAWKYKISLVGDPCGESIQSSSVQTIHSWVSQFGGNYTIEWDAYVVDAKSTVTWYKILSGNGLNALTVRDSVSGTLTSVTLPNTTDSIFVVGAELNGSKSFSGLALSNKTPNPTVTGIHETETVLFSLYPNPANDQLNLSIETNDFQVEVLTLLGQVLLTEHNTKVLDVRSLPQGIYIVSVIVDGVKTNKRFTKY